VLIIVHAEGDDTKLWYSLLNRWNHTGTEFSEGIRIESEYFWFELADSANKGIVRSNGRNDLNIVFSKDSREGFTKQAVVRQEKDVNA
jgi:hypothetical protein